MPRIHERQIDRARKIRAVELLFMIVSWFCHVIINLIHVITNLSKPTESTMPRVNLDVKLRTFGDNDVSMQVYQL